MTRPPHAPAPLSRALILEVEHALADAHLACAQFPQANVATPRLQLEGERVRGVACAELDGEPVCLSSGQFSGGGYPRGNWSRVSGERLPGVAAQPWTGADQLRAHMQLMIGQPDSWRHWALAQLPYGLMSLVGSIFALTLISAACSAFGQPRSVDELLTWPATAWILPANALASLACTTLPMTGWTRRQARARALLLALHHPSQEPE